MTQYFYDLSITDRSGKPVIPKGPASPSWQNSNVKVGKVNGLFAQLGFKSGGADAELGLAAGIDATNVEALLKTSVSFYNYGTDYSNTGGAAFFLRAQNSQWSNARATNGYYFALNGAGSLSLHARTLRVYSYADNAYGSLNVTGGTQMSAHTSSAFDEFYYLRVRAQGSQLMAKAWHESESEPSGWMLSTTDSTFAGSGDVFINFARGSAYCVPFFSVGTDGDSAPLSYPGGNRVISGILKKPDGTPAEGYLVRCYHRATGMLLDETLSSSSGGFVFSLPIPSTEQVYCLAIDQLGNSWNAPIKDLIAPI